MSEFEMEYVTCENCKSEYTVKVWDELDITENPALREKILRDEIITSKCKVCNHENTTVYPVICIDNKMKIIIWYLPVDEKEFKNSCNALNGELLGEYDVTSDYQLRVTDDYNELKEKIIARNENLDDRVLEIAKEVYKSQIVCDGSEIELEDIYGMYVNVGEKGQVVFDMLLSDERCMNIPLEQEVYDKICKDAAPFFDDKLRFQHVNTEFAIKILRNMVAKYEKEKGKEQF